MRVNQWISGELVSYADLNKENETMFAFASLFASMLLGVQDLNSATNGLATTVQSATEVDIGGGGQTFVLGNRIVNEPPLTALTVPPNTSGVTRTDTIYATFAELPVNSFSRGVRQADTTVVPTTVYESAQACAFTYVVAGGAVPAGGRPVAAVVVPNGGGVPTATVTLPTLASILAMIGVSSIDGAHGTLTLKSSNGSINVNVDVPSGTIDLIAAAAAAAVNSLNGLSGAVNLAAQDGSVAITPDPGSNSILIRANPAVSVASVNGKAGAVAIDAGDGIAIDNSGGDIKIINTADVHYYGSHYVAKAFTQGNGSHSLSLPNLPGNNLYILEAEWFGFRLPFSNSSATLAGGVGTWDFASRQAGPGGDLVKLTGTARGGQAPSVVASFSNSDEAVASVLLLKATAITGAL